MLLLFCFTVFAVHKKGALYSQNLPLPFPMCSCVKLAFVKKKERPSSVVAVANIIERILHVRIAPNLNSCSTSLLKDGLDTYLTRILVIHPWGNNRKCPLLLDCRDPVDWWQFVRVYAIFVSRTIPIRLLFARNCFQHVRELCLNKNSNFSITVIYRL